MTSVGIDAKNDYAFRCVFGSEHHTRILVHVLNAVLEPRPDQSVESVVILNPITEPLVLDDKLSVLDIRARDQTGRSFNVEMQMIAHGGLEGRLLYYWAKLYGSQLQSGDQYQTLEPTISICFLDGLLFAEADECRLSFRLWDPHVQLAFSDHLAIHLFQLPRFRKQVEDLSGPLDLWLYFLNNAKWLDPDNLPESLRVAELKEAVDVLRQLTQEERERERYEDRERARRDALSWAHERELWANERRQQQAELQRQKVEVQQQHFQVQQQQAQVQQQQAEIERRETRVASAVRIGQIRLCEELLRNSPRSDEQLRVMSRDELLELLQKLQGQLTS